MAIKHTRNELRLVSRRVYAHANSRNTLHQRMAQTVSSQTITSPLSKPNQASSPTVKTVVASAPFAFGVRRHGLSDRHRHDRVLASLRLEGNVFTAPKKIPQQMTVLWFERRNVRGVIARCVFAAARRDQLLSGVLLECPHFLLIAAWSGAQPRKAYVYR